MSSLKKVKSPSKIIISELPKISSIVLKTMKIISDVVGSTLGPSGRPVLLESDSYGKSNTVTKDGVSVFRALGFKDPVMHAIMESARDAATKTVAQAGDGTTSATVLSYSLVKNTVEFCKQNPTYTPQKVVREIEAFFKNVAEPFIRENALTRPEGDEESFKSVLEQVATISANGDKDLAQKVMQCFDIAGDEGAITIVEQSGPSDYLVEHIDGFSIEQGFENSMGRFFPLFVNDKANNRVLVDKPVFILYGNAITEPQTIQLFCEKIGAAWSNPQSFGLDKPFNHNVILVAPGFSESVLAGLAANLASPETINVIPMACQKSSIQHSELHFLQDLAAITGATVFDPITRPLDKGNLEDLGYGIQSFEMTRFRSNVIGYCEKDLVFDRIEELKVTLKNAESKFDAQLLEDRIARLGGGIAKLKIVGSSSAELREKRDRAEDAVAAVRGAIKHGALPGGGWTLARLSQLVAGPVGVFVIAPSLLYPIQKLLENCGLTNSEVQDLIPQIIQKSKEGRIVYDAMEGKFSDVEECGVYDSTPAVREAIRNSFSMSGILGTLGGLVVQERDEDLERQEASDTNHFMETVGIE
jgi:chaperonin GroEL